MSVIIGEDELAAGKVKIKENGLKEGHPEKNGVLVDLSDLVFEVKQRIKRKAELDGLTKEAAGLKVVGGSRGDEKEKETSEGKPEPGTALPEPSTVTEEAKPVS